MTMPNVSSFFLVGQFQTVGGGNSAVTVTASVNGGDPSPVNVNGIHPGEVESHDG